jgi:SAM-dependent methyltransferase
MSRPERPRRLAFEARADEYRHARPPYPARVYEILTQRCGLGPGTRVPEIGAGTGQATGELLVRGADVLAVEPGPRLAAHLVRDLGGERLRVVVDFIETVPLVDSSVDLVVSATAFHWVQADVALPRLARALRRPGWLAVWWTEFGDVERPTAFRHALDQLYLEYLPDEPRPKARGPLNVESWQDDLSQGGWFTRPCVEQIRWENAITPESARRLFGSFPNVNELDPARREEFLGAVGGLVRDAGGVVYDPHVTIVYLARPA